LYNAGDIETHFQLKINFDNNGIIPATRISLRENLDVSGAEIGALELKQINRIGEDTYVKINSKLNIIEGYKVDGKKSGNVYNYAVVAGSFFKLPLGESSMSFDNKNGIFECIEENPIEYDYYYF
jgi:hypothetical protein